MIADGLRTAFRCPAPRRAFACGVLLGALAACHFSPRAVEGVPFTEPWLVLPLNRWLAEDRAEPEAMAVCRPPVCGPGLVVGVVRLVGREAEIGDAVLSDPGKLVRALVTPKELQGTRSRDRLRQDPGGRCRPWVRDDRAAP